MRAIAILAVMAFHFTPIVSGGAQGVDVFFVLSGWLITTVLWREIVLTGKIDYPGFVKRRCRRLFPALAVMLAAYLIFVPFAAPEWSARRWYDVATSALYLTNVRETFWPANTPLAHTWSLAIEGQFYLVFPLVLVWLLRRRSLGYASGALCAAWAGLTIVRFAWAVMLPDSNATYYSSPLHVTGLLLGAGLALQPAPLKVGRYAFAVLLLVMMSGHSHATFLFTTPIVELATVLIILDPPSLLGSETLRWIGKVSYGIYLWHIPLLFAFGVPSTLSGLTSLMLCSVVAGALSYAFVERWFLRAAGAAERPGIAARQPINRADSWRPCPPRSAKR